MNHPMRSPAALFIAAVVLAGPVAAQRKAPRPESPAKLELTMEIATTDDDGSPSSLRVTIKNIGGVPVDMPVLAQACSPDNGFRIHASWSPDEPSGLGHGSGGACGMGDGPSLEYRVQHEWIRLRPGESMTTTERLRWTRYEDGPGSVEYWVEYTPPSMSEGEFARLTEAGYVIPTEELETPHASFHVQ